MNDYKDVIALVALMGVSIIAVRWSARFIFWAYFTWKYRKWND